MWKEKKLEELTIIEFYEILHLRIQTFVIEQKRIYEELDDNDKHSFHIFYINPTTNKVEAYARVFEKHDYITFGRVVIDEQQRGSGLGRILTEKIIECCKYNFENKLIKIEAQEQVVGFYKKFGFKEIGSSFLFEGTPHVEMELKL